MDYELFGGVSKGKEACEEGICEGCVEKCCVLFKTAMFFQTLRFDGVDEIATKLNITQRSSALRDIAGYDTLAFLSFT